ncbi:MAG: hypothetical protein ACTSUE_11125 [Promethearchaeota archaeon]
MSTHPRKIKQVSGSKVAIRSFHVREARIEICQVPLIHIDSSITRALSNGSWHSGLTCFISQSTPRSNVTRWVNPTPGMI